MQDTTQDQSKSAQRYQVSDWDVEQSIGVVILQMKERKPNDLSEEDRKIAIAITEAEKLLAWWRYIFPG